MTLLTHEHYCDELIAQTLLFREHLAGADLSAQVPTCPEWNLRELAVHVGGAHRWVEWTLRTKPAEGFTIDQVTAEQVPGFDGPGSDDPKALDAWLAEGCQQAARTLREAGPDTAVWSWSWDRTAGFWARRATHETMVHRADAALTIGTQFDITPDVAADALDELLQIIGFVQRAMPEHNAVELRGAGRSIHLHATDAAPALNAEWLINFNQDGFTWCRGHDKATVALHGPLAELLQIFYRRRTADDASVKVLGDRALLDFWLERTVFG
ncbi:maleylpyruvate isomerase family mycothiol-dependent enzyme [Streptomyces sp. T-3]|nr:maleylpyruvate isomerase family mycothiol-dependent enzyme [Streptomyces sp. T-3]